MDEPLIDCHVNVFDQDRFPYAADAYYTPTVPETGMVDQLRRTHDVHGVRHALLVGPKSGYGEDNRCLLDAVARGAGRFRGVAVVSNRATPAELSGLRDAGVLGVTLNAALLGVEYYAEAGRLLSTLADLDMIADVQVAGDQLPVLAPLLARWGVRVLIDHCGPSDPADGLDAPGFRELLRLGRDGRSVVMLSGLVTFSHRPPSHEDTGPFVRALVDAFGPDRCVWGGGLAVPARAASHRLRPVGRGPDELVPDRVARRQILWDTPLRVFAFPG